MSNIPAIPRRDFFEIQADLEKVTAKPGAETRTDGPVATPDVRPRLGALRRERLAVFRAARAADTVGNERKTEPWNLLWFAGCRISEAPVDPVLVLR